MRRAHGARRPSVTSPRVGTGTLVIVGFIVAFVAVLATWRVGNDGSMPPGAEDAIISVPTGLPTQAAPQAVANVAIARMQQMASEGAGAAGLTIDTISAARRDEVDEFEPSAAMPDAGDHRVVWVVRAHGPFIGTRVPEGHEPIRASSGYFVIDDSTLQIIEMGLP